MPKQENNKLTFVYTRVSSERQASEGMSLEVQLQQIRKFAENRNLQIVKEFEEADSASELDRPIFNKMLEELKKSQAKNVIFHSCDRSARNPFDQAKIFKLMQEGYEFYFVAENLCTDNPTARGMILIMWGMASSFTEILKMHVNKGIIGMINDGRSLNPAPIGYVDKGKGVKEPDPVQGRMVKRAFELYSTGQYDIVSLAKKLKDIGLRNKQGNPVSHKVLYKLFRKPFYYGMISFRDELFPGKHQPVITKKLFDKVQAVLEGRGFKHKRIFAYVFQGLISCPSCGKTLRSISAQRHYKYYNCRDRMCKFRATVAETEVEAKFLDELKKIEFTDGEVEMFLRAVKQFRKDLGEDKTNQVKYLQMEEAKLDGYLEDLLTKYLEKKITDDEYKNMKSKYLNKRQDAEERKTALVKADAEICNQIEKIGKLLKKPLNAYFLASDDQKRALVKSMVENIKWGTENNYIYWKKEFQIVAERIRVVSGSPTGNRTPI